MLKAMFHACAVKIAKDRRAFKAEYQPNRLENAEKRYRKRR